MTRYNRKSTPKVVDGRVQKKNRHDPTPTYWTNRQSLPQIDKERPGRGFRHLLSKENIFEFIEIIPDWENVSEGLDAVLLAKRELGCDGWYNHGGVIGICAWERDLWRVGISQSWYKEHRKLLMRLGVDCVPEKHDCVTCKFTEEQALAYQLLHIFLHELGHHRDRMTSKRQISPGRGEHFAEGWALENEARIWDAYIQKFGLP